MLKKTTVLLALTLLLNNLLGSVLGSFFFLTGMSFSKSAWVPITFTCLNTLILWSMIYTSGWHEAHKDKNRIKYNHMKLFVPKAAVAGALATIPFLIVYFLYIFNSTYNITGSLSVLYYIIYVVFNLPYLSFVVAFKSNAAVLALLFLPMPIVSSLGYLAGYKNFTMMDKLIYQNKKKTPKKNPAAR